MHGEIYVKPVFPVIVTVPLCSDPELVHEIDSMLPVPESWRIDMGGFRTMKFSCREREDLNLGPCNCQFSSCISGKCFITELLFAASSVHYFMVNSSPNRQ